MLITFFKLIRFIYKKAVYLNIIKNKQKLNKMKNFKTYNISQETLEKALIYMKSEEYLEQDETIEDLLSYARSMAGNDTYFITAKINQWANS